MPRWQLLALGMVLFSAGWVAETVITGRARTVGRKTSEFNRGPAAASHHTRPADYTTSVELIGVTHHDQVRTARAPPPPAAP